MSQTDSVLQFSFNWNIKWPDTYIRFENSDIASISKPFVTAFKNVPFQWCAFFTTEKRDDGESSFGFTTIYVEGPLADLEGIEWKIDLIKDGKIVGTLGEAGPFNAKPFSSSSLVSYPKASLQSEYGLTDSDPLLFRFTIKIPMASFFYSLKNPLPTIDTAPWLRDMFEKIEDPNEAIYHTVTFISREGKTFYCDKNIIGNQCKQFATQFLQCESEEEEEAEDDDDDDDESEYEFPEISGAALKALLEYMYTGRTTFAGLSTKEVSELADAAEQCEMKQLAIACGSILWDRVVANPEECYAVAEFADSHEDMECLKKRAFDVLVDNYERFDLEFGGVEKFDGDDGKKLRDHFVSYMSRRLQPLFGE